MALDLTPAFKITCRVFFHFGTAKVLYSDPESVFVSTQMASDRYKKNDPHNRSNHDACQICRCSGNKKMTLVEQIVIDLIECSWGKMWIHPLTSLLYPVPSSSEFQ